ncbi:membrane protein [Vibrio cholerae]|nr:membrane protein [Vibrio cholerae]HDI3228225.1 hypothetical protein [Vibrio cholerae]
MIDIKDEKITDYEAYKIALETRNFEINLFWQRSNYFLVLNATLALGFFKLDSEQEYALLLAFFGLLASFLWYRVNLGSKYWQSRWENRLKIREKLLSSDLELFSASWETIDLDVKETIENTHKGKRYFQKWLNRQILHKPSVSYNMILLSLVFFFAWLCLLFFRIYHFS